MKDKDLVAFKSKLFINPCNKFLKLFKFRFKRPLGLQFRRRRRSSGTTTTSTTTPKSYGKNRFRGLLSIFRSPRKEKEYVAMDDHQIGVHASMKDIEHERQLFPSPITPSYAKVKTVNCGKGSSSSQAEVDDACRSFENYLGQMIVNEKKLRDLNDVEELLYCWKNLKSPVFIDLVCRFYGELCKDLFSS
ncbi:hypothetical protein Scep_014751 [Stephania cephalantha]|uniref:OVATE domain-containing protein n=1 Tax=Stephania cephalantha TaxID=152367 RepID=A0AAP0P234_9MAGN